MTALTRATFLAETRQFGDRTRYTQFSGRNLRDCDLSRLDLRTLNLRDSWLVAARLDGADLTYTDLRGANLAGASVRGADLSGALIDPATAWHGVMADRLLPRRQRRHRPVQPFATGPGIAGAR
jgi:uncharacterized protein YjbI with pentapeptide repeats